MKALREPLWWLIALFIGLLAGLPYSAPLFSRLFPELPRPVYQQESFWALTLDHGWLVVASSLAATAIGLGSIPPGVSGVAEGMGMTGWQRLYKVELPLAAPVILAGIRTSVIVNIGTATIASTVGASTLGTPIIIGLSGFNTAYIVQGALLVALAAIIVDRAFERLTRWISRHRHAQ